MLKETINKIAIDDVVNAAKSYAANILTFAGSSKL